MWFSNIILLQLICINSVLLISPSRIPITDAIENEGYPVESHYVTTSDGYIMNIHRIPYGRKRQFKNKVAYLEHGLLCSSYQWILAGPKKSLAYILADEGYDVWMGNARGNVYSRNHTTLNPDKDRDFWNFSWHEIGIYDLPASIDYVLKQTGNTSLYYVGHSQGTTSMYVMASLKQEYNSKIKVYVHLSPVAFMTHLISPVYRSLAPFDRIVEAIVPLIGAEEFFPFDSPLSKLFYATCALPGTRETLCALSYFLVSGYSPKETNYTLLPELLKYVPAGSATKQYIHYIQEINSGRFRQYDYGVLGNLKRYGKATPPDYDLNKVVAPGYLIYAKDDWLADYKIDVPKLYDGLKNCLGKYLIPIQFGHMDFLIGIHAPKVAYETLLNYFAQH